MTATTRPDVAFKNWLYANWNCDVEGALKADIDFQNNDWTNHQIQTGRPIIVVKMAGVRRLQDEESSLFRFFILVEIGVHPASIAETDTKRTLQWTIVNYFKSLVDSFTLSSITNWKQAILKTTANTDAAIPLPEDLITNLTVEAVIAWLTS